MKFVTFPTFVYVLSEKRGRGRPRRYPRPGDPDVNALPAFILPGVGGQTVLLTPAQVSRSITCYLLCLTVVFTA